MLKTLYRYQHPHNLEKFIYVGQGPQRDSYHRSGRTSFGARFKKKFPDVELPRPIKEIVEVENQLELNELETIWMFQYHTWKVYKDGMNLRFPGDIDYAGIMTPEQHRENGLNAFKNRTGIHAENFDKTVAGRTSFERKVGIHSPDTDNVKTGKKGAAINIASGQLEWVRNLPQTKEAQSRNMGQIQHRLWHINRNKPNPRCAFCSEENLVIAYA